MGLNAFVFGGVVRVEEIFKGLIPFLFCDRMLFIW
ncbi:unknown protein [Desulfotalea psychrophila LSv54]|uniref:Uncharacterized protein n=2 Tax=Desulfotalea psychrophila TaxID=84980 RepID=Q6AJ93_DESPS|nr:unknown protein [Desulfotalea psychrophila LSv54]